MTTINRKRRRLIEKIEKLSTGPLYITDCNGGLGGRLVEVRKKTLLELLTRAHDEPTNRLDLNVKGV